MNDFKQLLKEETKNNLIEALKAVKDGKKADAKILFNAALEDDRLLEKIQGANYQVDELTSLMFDECERKLLDK